MKMPDPDDVIGISVVVLIFAFVIMLIVCLACFLVGEQHDRSSRHACHDTGGKVDYYDKDHPDSWRCIPPTMERAP